MDAEKTFDKFFNKFIDSFKFLEEMNFAEKWFMWLEWITITAAIYAVARSTNSSILTIVALFSILLIFFKGMFSFEKTIEKKLYEMKRAEKFNKTTIFVVAALLGLFPVSLIIFVGNLISGLIETIT